MAMYVTITLSASNHSSEEAIDLAKRDTDQFDVERFLAYRGDAETRTTMEFNVLFRSGDSVWLPYTQDIFQTQNSVLGTMYLIPDGIRYFFFWY